MADINWHNLTQHSPNWSAYKSYGTCHGHEHKRLYILNIKRESKGFLGRVFHLVRQVIRASDLFLPEGKRKKARLRDRQSIDHPCERANIVTRSKD